MPPAVIRQDTPRGPGRRMSFGDPDFYGFVAVAGPDFVLAMLFVAAWPTA
jgi:hypothetical protein